MFAFVNDAGAVGQIVTSPGGDDVLTTTGHAQVLAPSWMCAMFIGRAGREP